MHPPSGPQAAVPCAIEQRAHEPVDAHPYAGSDWLTQLLEQAFSAAEHVTEPGGTVATSPPSARLPPASRSAAGRSKSAPMREAQPTSAAPRNISTLRTLLLA
jgi:hypothetical protein